MCGIVGLFAKHPDVEERLGEHLGAMLTQMANRGPDSAGIAIYRDPAPAGTTKLSLYEDGRARGRDVADGDVAAALAARARRAARRAGHERGSAWRSSRRSATRATSSSASSSPRCRARTGSATRAWRPRARSRPRARTRSPPGSDLCLVHNGSLSNHNALRRRLRHEGIAFRTENDTEVAAGYLEWRLREGDTLRGGARGLPGRPRRLLHVRGRHRGRLRGAARPDRVQAGGDGRERRVGGDGVRVPRDRRPARAPTPRRCGSPSRVACTRGSGSGLMTVTEAIEAVDLAETPLRELNRRLHAADVAPRWRVTHPNGAHAVAVGIDADIEVDVDGHVGYYCAGMNKRATVRVHGNAGVGLAENIMSGTVVVDGYAGQSCAATGRGGLVVVRGDACARCGISMKGVDIVVRGLGRAHERVHGPEGRARRLRRRRRGARRLDLRGAPVRPRHGRLARRRLRREGAAPGARGRAARPARRAPA